MTYSLPDDKLYRRFVEWLTNPGGKVAQGMAFPGDDNEFALNYNQVASMKVFLRPQDEGSDDEPEVLGKGHQRK